MQDACCFKEAQEAFNRETHDPTLDATVTGVLTAQQSIL